MNEDTQTAARAPIVASTIGIAVVFLAGEPLVLGPPTFSAGYILRHVALLALGAYALSAAALGRSRLPLPRGPTLAWTLLPLLIVVPAVFALTDARAAVHPLSTYGLRWIVLAVPPLALAFVFGRAEGLGRVLGWLAALAGLLAICGIIEGVGSGKVAASFGRPAVAGAVFGALIVPALLFGPGRDTPMRWVLPAFLFIAMLTTVSRAAIVAAVFGALFAAAVGVTSPVWKKRVNIALVVLMALATVGAGLAARGALELPGGNRTLEVRLGLHRASMALIGERPAMGHGLGRYPVEALRRRDANEAHLEPGRRPEHAHLDLLHVSVEGGLLAGLALFLFVGGAFALASRRAKGADAGTRRALAAAVAVIATLAITGFGDGILIDPGPLLLVVVAVAAVLAARPRGHAEVPDDVPPAAPAPLAWRIAWGVGAAGIGVFAVMAGTTAVADRHTQAYVNTRIDTERQSNAAVLSPQASWDRMRAAKADHLDVAIRLDPKNAEAQYQLGVYLASSDEKTSQAAIRAYRAALEADPGKTEARLDMAHVFELTERPDDARAALEEATRSDPTRYDTWMRLGHLALGPEPVPGDPPVDRDWAAVLRPYNQARLLAPDRFENDVALARVMRRRATSKSDLTEADLLLEKSASRFAPKHSIGAERARKMFLRAPAEISLEAFRIAEAMGAGDLVLFEFLQFALMKEPALGEGIAHEVDRLFAVGLEREGDARRQAAESLDPTVFEPVERVFDAAAVRLAALMLTNHVDGPEQLTNARKDRVAKRYRTALARYRAILAWAAGPGVTDVRGLGRNDSIRWRADLLKETAVVASRVDAGRARTYWAQHFVLEGLIALGSGEDENAVGKLRSAIEYDAEFADAHFALARAYCRQAEFEFGAKALLKALALDPSGNRKQAAMAEPDLLPIIRRPEVAEVLGE